MHQAFLTLDLGTKMGWALQYPDGRVRHGVVSFAPRKGARRGERYHRFRRWLAEMKALTPRLDGVGYELVAGHKGTTAAQVYGGFEATLTAWCEHHGIDYRGVYATTLKKAVAGNGGASKELMRAVVRAAGFNPSDLNESDALAVLLYLRRRGLDA